MAVKVTGAALQLGTHSYTRKECGASHGGHSNLSGYLSLTDGNGAAAVLLKQKLAPTASSISRDFGRNINFAESAMKAYPNSKEGAQSARPRICL